MCPGDPGADGGQVHDLIGPDADEEGVRGSVAFLEVADPPVEGLTGVDEEVDSAQDQAAFPVQSQSQGEAMEGGVHPAGGVAEVGLVERHPVVLQEPVGDEVGEQGTFEGGECEVIHGRKSLCCGCGERRPGRFSCFLLLARPSVRG